MSNNRSSRLATKSRSNTNNSGELQRLGCQINFPNIVQRVLNELDHADPQMS